MRKIVKEIISKDELINSVLGTYDNSRFFCGESVEETTDFKLGLERNWGVFYEKDKLLDAIRTKADAEMALMPGHPDYIVLCSCLYLSRNSVNENQVFHTNPPEGYTRVAEGPDGNHHVYVKVDKTRKTISFLLGNVEKTLALETGTEWTYKLSGNRLLCLSADDLERFINNRSWSRSVVKLGRRVLRIPNPV